MLKANKEKKANTQYKYFQRSKFLIGNREFKQQLFLRINCLNKKFISIHPYNKYTKNKKRDKVEKCMIENLKNKVPLYGNNGSANLTTTLVIGLSQAIIIATLSLTYFLFLQ